MPSRIEPDWLTAKNILCVRLDTLGDVVMTSPAIRALKQSLNGRITLLTSSRGKAAAELFPEIDEILVYDAPWMKATPERDTSTPDLNLIAQLQKRAFDAAVIFTVFSQNPLAAAFMCYLAEIPLRLAYCRENPYQLLTHWVPEPDELPHLRHEVRRHLDLVEHIGCKITDERIRIPVPAAALATARRKLTETGVDLDRPWVVIHPGASAPSRRYRPEGFAAVAQHLASAAGMQVIFTGSEAETQLIESIRSAMQAPSFSLAGQLNLVELTAVLKLAPLLISNNTGPVHLAAGTGTPVVDIYALTNPQHTPWQVPTRVVTHEVPCKNCFKSICPEGHHNCLRLIRPEEIVTAVFQLLQETAEDALLRDPTGEDTRGPITLELR
jgi:lipopolysaccharide heptosyltransferase II